MDTIRQFVEADIDTVVGREHGEVLLVLWRCIGGQCFEALNLSVGKLDVVQVDQTFHEDGGTVLVFIRDQLSDADDFLGSLCEALFGEDSFDLSRFDDSGLI